MRNPQRPGITAKRFEHSAKSGTAVERRSLNHLRIEDESLKQQFIALSHVIRSIHDR